MPTGSTPEIMIAAIARMLRGLDHIAVGASSPIPGSAALLVRALSNGATRVSLLGSREHNPFTDGGKELLKLSEEEAAIVANGAFAEQVAVRLGVPEILLTYGSRGAEVFVDGGHQAIPAPWVVEGVQATGAGDVFMVGYAASRIAGAAPLAAAAAIEVSFRRRRRRKRRWAATP